MEEAQLLAAGPGSLQGVLQQLSAPAVGTSVIFISGMVLFLAGRMGGMFLRFFSLFSIYFEIHF